MCESIVLCSIYVYHVVVKKFTFAISSSDELLVNFATTNRHSALPESKHVTNNCCCCVRESMITHCSPDVVIKHFKTSFI